VNISLTSLGTKRIRITNLPPEVSNDTLRATLAPYGKIMDIQNERWSKAYRYSVANGVRQVTMCLSRHVPSHLTVAGQRVLVSYEGKPANCYGVVARRAICIRSALHVKNREL
jgi:RNA recognition motif-containing protein